MSTLIVIVGALFLAVVGRGILDPWPPPDPTPLKDAEDHALMIEGIVHSVF